MSFAQKETFKTTTTTTTKIVPVLFSGHNTILNSHLPPLLTYTLFTTACMSGLQSGVSCQQAVINAAIFSGISS